MTPFQAPAFKWAPITWDMTQDGSARFPNKTGPTETKHRIVLSNLIQERTHKVSWVSLTDILEHVAYLHPKIHHPPKISSYENGKHQQVMSVSGSTSVCKQDQPSECWQQERMGHAWGCFWRVPHKSHPLRCFCWVSTGLGKKSSFLCSCSS